MAAAICVLVALASLALPSGPTYDPYAWLIWGRDLAHLDLVTTAGGTSWKPLPAVVDALLSPLGGGAAQGWLVVARAGALFAVYMAFRLAWRLAPERFRVLAGVCAAAALVLTREFVMRNGVGNAEGLMVAFGLLAVDRHLDGKRGQAYALLVAAALIRAEMWPFVFAYGAWMWWRGEHRVALLFGAALIPLMWFGGDWLGSGNAATAANRALQPVPGSAGVSPHPARAVVSEAINMLPLAGWIAFVVALIATIRAPARHRAVFWLATWAAAWTVIVAVMAERGYAGLPRFLFMATGLEAVVAGVGCALLADAIANAVEPRHLRVATAMASVLVVVLVAAGSIANARLLPSDAASIDHVADMDAGLVRAVNRAGGAAELLRCGDPSTPWYTVTALAWDLDVQTSQIQNASNAVRPPAPRCRVVAGSTQRD